MLPCLKLEIKVFLPPVIFISYSSHFFCELARVLPLSLSPGCLDDTSPWDMELSPCTPPTHCSVSSSSALPGALPLPREDDLPPHAKVKEQVLKSVAAAKLLTVKIRKCGFSSCFKTAFDNSNYRQLPNAGKI